MNDPRLTQLDPDHVLVEPAKLDLYHELKSPGTQMAMAMARVKRDSEVYGGTVPHHVKAARRAKNKRARAGRKSQRGSK